MKSSFHPFLQLIPQPVEINDNDKDIKIFCLGGSTTEFMNSKGIGWPEITEKIINNKLKRDDIRFYNQGRQWYTTLHTLINYQTNIRKYKPDVIIIMHTINDLLNNADFSYFSMGEFRPDYGHFLGPINATVNQGYHVSKIKNGLKKYWYYKPLESIYQEIFKGEASFDQNLNTIIDLAQLDNTKVVLITQPSLYKKNPDKEIFPRLYMLNNEAIGKDKQWTYETALNGFIRYEHIIKKIAKERNVFLLDLNADIPKTLEYFYDDVHYTEKAFDLVAQKVADGLIELGIIK